MTTTAVTTNTAMRLDLGFTGEKRPVNQFNSLAENVLCTLVNHGNTLNEFYQLKDELLQYDLPPSFLLQILLLTSKTSRSFADMNVLVNEVVKLIQQYSSPWDEKSEVLKRLRNDYKRKQDQLLIAIKQLEMAAMQEQHMNKERRLNLWMKLYNKTMATKSVGRRWKFRIEPFKRKLAKGGNPYDSDSDSEDETDPAVHHALTPSDIGEDELQESDKANELSQALSLKLGDALKKVQFADFDDDSAPESPMTGTRPLVETETTASWTGELEYDYYLMALMYRPQGVLPYKELTCTIALADTLYTSTQYKTERESEDYQVFRFPLSDNDASYLPVLLKDPEEETDRYRTPKLSVAVYPDNIANQVAAHCTTPISKITLNGDPQVVVPPVYNNHTVVNEKWAGMNPEMEEDDIGSKTQSDVHVNDEELSTTGSQTETKLWEPDWEGLINEVLIHDPEPIVYPLKVLQDPSNEEDDSIDGDSAPPHIPIITQVVKVQRRNQFEVGLNTQSWDSLMHTMGYKKLTETESVALSALYLDPSKATTPAETPVPPVEEEEEESKLSAAEVAQMTLKHAEELKQLQDQYDAKLQSLSRMLSKVKSDKQKEIEELEQALIQSEASKSKNKMRSPSELREMLSRKKRLNKLTKGLPEWGKNLPDNFYERLELFAYESMRKNAEMTEKIKREVKEVCERQLESLHKLAPIPSFSSSVDPEDVCIPASFMPTPTNRHVIYNPRASKYFHPYGSDLSRVSQVPAIFKLPPIESSTTGAGSLPTLNLYELSQQELVTKPGPLWVQNTTESPRYTPAPPPSACDYYLPPPMDRKHLFNTQQPKQNED